MSLIEEARTVRQRIAARLRELEPLVREYEELRRAAAEMGIDDEEFAAPPEVAAPAAPAPSRPGRGRGRASSRTSTPTRQAAAGELGDRVLEAVRAEPGQTVAEYARALEVAPTALYRPVRELTTAGAIVKRARQLFPN